MNNDNFILISAKKQGFSVLENGRPLHSKVDPIQEANNWVAKQTPGRADLLIVHEFGLGYIIDPLVDKMTNYLQKSPLYLGQGKKADYQIRGIVFVNERRSLKDLGMGNKIFFKNGNYSIPILFLDPDNVNEIHAFLDNIEAQYSIGHRILKTTVPSQHTKVLNYVLQAFSAKLSDLLTRIEFEKLWINNIIANCCQKKDIKPIRILEGQFSGQTAVIIGAGPSLHQAIDFLFKIRPYALLIATDTALPILLSKGINPHIVYSLDSQKHSLKHFLPILNDTAIKKIHLVADIVAYPKLLREWPGPIWLATTAQYIQISHGQQRLATPMTSWVEERVGMLGDIQSGGSVSTSAFDLARILGCIKVIFIGQDFSYIGREIHAQGSHHNAHWLSICNRLSGIDNINQSIINKRSILYLPTISSSLKEKDKSQIIVSDIETKVVSDYVFNMYRNWFTMAFEIAKLKIVFPISNGAFIDHCEYYNYDSMINAFAGPSISSPSSTPKTKKNIENTLSTLWQKNHPLPWKFVVQSLSEFKNSLESIINNEKLSEKEFKVLDIQSNLTSSYPFMCVFFRKTDIARRRGFLENDRLKSAHLKNQFQEELQILLRTLNQNLPI